MLVVSESQKTHSRPLRVLEWGTQAIQEIKGNTSKWLNDLGLRFAWQEGYSAFSVSQSQRQKVVDYIDGQAEHHKEWSFEQEFLSLLKKSGIAYDERYVLG